MRVPEIELALQLIVFLVERPSGHEDPNGHCLPEIKGFSVDGEAEQFEIQKELHFVVNEMLPEI